MAAERKVRVLVVDDSATTRRLLTASLRGEPDIEVVAEASNVLAAQTMIAQYRPDVMTLDLVMPQMDGLTFLRHLMKHRPLPVIVLSSHTPAGSAAALEAMQAGAIDVISKPQGLLSVSNIAGRLKQRIREVRDCHVRFRPMPHGDAVAGKSAAPLIISAPINGLIAIGTSAGGPQALELLLTHLPAQIPPIVIVQHMPVPFTRLFAERLNEICPMRVVEATDQQELRPGVVYLAPGDHHLIVEQREGRLRAGIRRGPPVHHQRPAVDVLFHSLARIRGVPIVGILLTGMGHDGADGMVALRRAGQETIAEDPRSCAVFGMPREAIARGGATHVAMLEQIPAVIFNCFERAATRS